MTGIFAWRRRRDLNSRAGYPTYTLSRGASSPLEYFCILCVLGDVTRIFNYTYSAGACQAFFEKIR